MTNVHAHRPASTSRQYLIHTCCTAIFSELKLSLLEEGSRPLKLTRFTRLLPKVTEARASAGAGGGGGGGSEQISCLEETLSPAELPAGCAEFPWMQLLCTLVSCMCNAAAFETSIYSPE